MFGEGWGRYFWKCEPQRRKRAWWALCGVWMLRGNIVWKDREAWRGDVWRAGGGSATELLQEYHLWLLYILKLLIIQHPPPLKKIKINYPMWLRFPRSATN